MESHDKNDYDRTQETKGIRAMLILETIGRPPEHLVEALEKLAKMIDEEPRAKILSKKIKEPVLMKDQKDFYTTFMELEVEVEEITDLAILMFKYMPAHLEVISPDLIALTAHGWNDIFNELTRRLHAYDEVARVVQAEKSILEKKLRSVLEEKKPNNPNVEEEKKD